MSEERLYVAESASKALFNILAESGGLPGKTLDQLHERLLSTSNKLWEGGKVSTFNDGQGSGWLIDISRGFQDIMLYGVVRSVDGGRAVVDVIDEGELENMKKGKEGAPEAKAEEPSEPRSRGVSKVIPRRPPKDDAPALLRWRTHYIQADPETQDVNPVWEEERLVYREVGAKVQELLTRGIKAEDIEIWTERKKPQVNVVLV